MSRRGRPSSTTDDDHGVDVEEDTELDTADDDEQSPPDAVDPEDEEPPEGKYDDREQEAREQENPDNHRDEEPFQSE